ncbi:MAG: aldehyde dehydrogenase family protein [Bacillota bacterium]
MIKKQLFINGEWCEAKNHTPLFSPYTGELIAKVPEATVEEVDLAIEAAYQARNTMEEMPSHQRAKILESLANLLEERADEAAILISKESAKPLKDAKGEVARTVQTYKFAAEEAKRLNGETVPMDAAPGGEGRLAYTLKVPLGVVGAITPFNFPMNLVAHKVGPAIATGNTVVLKPAGQTPLSAYFLAELLQEAGLPPGCLNVVTGSGSVVGGKLVKDDRVKKISFTGSPKVGISIRNQAKLKPVTLELGSNAAVIIDKHVDIEKIVPRCITGAFSSQGQVCISLQRIYVHKDCYDRFVERFVKATRGLKVGDPLNPHTDVSALINRKEVDRTLAWIDEAKQKGAIVAEGGTSEGSILHPTVLLEVEKSAKVSCQEVFAPIVLINKVESVEEAIDLVNDSRYGLQAGIYTESVHTAMHASKKLHVGGVLINDIPTFRVDHMPYGGVKESGVGREGIKYAMEDMTELKLVIFNNN